MTQNKLKIHQSRINMGDLFVNLLLNLNDCPHEVHEQPH